MKYRGFTAIERKSCIFISCDFLAFDQLIFEVVQGFVVQVKLAFQRAVGDPSGVLEEEDGLFDNVGEFHDES